jgi:electron transport complex protein RnfC
LFNKFSFLGGIHPPHNKKQTKNESISNFPPVEKVIIPMSMHIGAPAKVLVKKGDHVKAGTPIGEAGGFVSVPIHSSISGEVVAVGSYPHPLGRQVTAVEIKSDGKNETEFLPPITKWHEAASGELINRVTECGVVGMGGASFPTHVKLSPPPEKTIDTLIINGAECEPYLTADHRLMLEKSTEFLTGVAIIQRILDVSEVFIGIEKNKPDVIKAVKKTIKGEKEFSSIKVISLETKYPQGGEKQLITSITGREVPSGGLPMEAHCVVQNSGTAFAVYEAILLGKPLYERVVTVTGDAVSKPANLLIPVGTPISTVLNHCEFDSEKSKKVLMGGPMMGMALSNLEAPVIKSTSGILTLSSLVPPVMESPCINCGACVHVCPIHLVPSHLSRLSFKGMYDDAKNENILDCIECGCCSFECPSKINLLHFIRLGKNRVITASRAKNSK